MTDKTKKTVYIFDTSAFSALHRHHTQVMSLPKEIWDSLAKMMKEGKVISHHYVYAEAVNEKAERPDFLTAWLIPRKHCFHKDNAHQAILVSEIVEKFPKLIEPDKEKEQADPWIIAQAIELSEQTSMFEEVEYVVVTQENKASSKKIPAACRHFKIRPINLKEFFEENSLAVQIHS